jgi:hypothetical protein
VTHSLTIQLEKRGFVMGDRSAAMGFKVTPEDAGSMFLEKESGQ